MRFDLRVLGGLLATAVLLGLPACGGDDEAPGSERSASPPRNDGRPVLCAGLRGRITGEVSAPAATELSGLAISRSQRGVLWTHNDSGDSARLFALSTKGRLLLELSLSGALAVDWEDMAEGRNALYVGDIGDNESERPNVVVYRVAEPRVKGSAKQASAAAGALVLRYPDGAHDAEALLVSPTTGALFIVTKSFDGKAGVYVSARPRTNGVNTMRRVATISLGSGEAITAGDVSADGRTIVVRTYFRAFAWTRRRGESIAETLRRKPCAADAELFDEGQGETLALTRNGRAFYTVPEGELPDVRRYAPR